MPSPKKLRLDQLLLERELVAQLSEAKAMIMAGQVRVNGERIDKAGHSTGHDSHLELEEKNRFVSRGGLKLNAALLHFNVAVTGMICADVGAATGGFTDALLQHGAAKVYAIDVGYGDLAYRLRSDPRVYPIERTNARKLESLPETPSMVVIDASFISLTTLLPVVHGWFKVGGSIIALIKPQFEARRDQVPDGGVIRDTTVQNATVERVQSCALGLGMRVLGIMPSPIEGTFGNREFLIYLGVLGGLGDLTTKRRTT